VNVLLVTAHPCADSFTHAVAAAAQRGLEHGAHDVTTLDLYALEFAPAMTPAEWAAYDSGQPLIEPLTREHARLVQRADMLVFVYPTWWSGPPAILRGWLERVFVPGVAFRFDARGKVRPALTNVREIVGISTYGSPRLFVKLLNDGGRRMLTRALRLNCGWRTRTKWLALYALDTLSEAERRAFLERVEHSMSRRGRP
jgi:putative NADPH-quinone reductase